MTIFDPSTTPSRDHARRDRPFRERLGRALADVAPGLASALGGPMAGAAAEAVRRAVLGEGVADEDAAVEAAIRTATPETLAALRDAELAFARAVLDGQLAAAKIAAADRDNARAREIARRDPTPAVLGFAVITGFFVVVAIMLSREVPPGAETEFSILLGALATMTAAVVNYYFGSSADSHEKTRLIGGFGR